MSEDIEQHIINKIEECINSAEASLLYADPENVNLFLPKIAIDNLINHFNNNIYKANFLKFEIGNVLKYNGYNVLLGYELAIIIAHIDSPIHPHLINRVTL